jgi:hypothetical protein
MTLSLALSALALAIRAVIEVMVEDGGTRITLGDEPSSVIGRKSLNGS